MTESNPPTRDDQTLSAYIDGELTAEEARAVEAWLADDATARGLVEELRSIAAAVQDLPAQLLSEEWKKALSQRLDRATLAASPTPIDEVVAVAPRVSVGRSSRGWWWSAGAIAAALMVAFMLPRDENDQVAKAPIEKPRAIGGELGTVAENGAIRNADEKSLEGALGMDGEDDLDADAALTDNFAGVAEPRLELHKQINRAAPSDAPAMELPAARGADFGLADARAARDRASFADLADDESAETSAAAAGTYLVVWADVPAESLQKQTINTVLTSNGIEVERRTDDWTAAPEQLREQIASRNLKQPELDDERTKSRGGFGGGRFSVPEQLQETEEAVHQLVDKEEDENGLPAVAEGETILVEASVEQIAACLVDM
ncbi:MAG: hypothetical protein ACR2NU_15450, partial [Aeoliella sp.]